MHKQISFFFGLVLAIYMLPTSAEIYKHVDADGRVTYSNVKIKGAKKLDLEPADTNFGNDVKSEKPNTSATKKATPSDFPKVDSQTQNQRDQKRKEILSQELAQEKQALEQAKQAYAEGESNPEVFKNADGKTFRNVPKFQEKMKNLQAEVDAHERNIELLNKEINQLSN
jgi:chromosome segregation ATPase